MLLVILVFLISISSLLIFHSYVIYPLSLLLIKNGRSFSIVSSNNLPIVSVLVPAYNEESNIERKLRNLFGLEYPSSKLEIIVGIDGATDRTYELASSFDQENLSVINYDIRKGKVTVMNKLAAEAKGEILVFTDADVELDGCSLANLVKHFADEKVGGVCGNFVLRPSGASAESKDEITYWKMENWIKNLEGEHGVVLGANGGIYAVRRKSFVPLEIEIPIADDFILPLKILERGDKFLYEPKALAYGKPASYRDEFRRKVRIGGQNFSGLKLLRHFLNPSRGFVSYALWSHKVLRWFTPHLLLLILICNAILASNLDFFYLTLKLQMVFYGIAIIGIIGFLLKMKLPIFSQVGYFVSSNAAMLMGFIKAVSKDQETKWEVLRD